MRPLPRWTLAAAIAASTGAVGACGASNAGGAHGDSNPATEPAPDAGVISPDANAVDAQDPLLDPRVKELIGFVTNDIQANHVPGASFAVVLNGKLYYAGGVGSRRLGGIDSVDGSTLYRVGSLTKMVTAATLLTLVDEAKVDVSTTIAQYLPSFQLLAPFDATQLQAQELLTHSSGLPDIVDLNCSETRASWFAQYPQPLWAPPGKLFNYSSFGFDVLGHLAETVAGEPYEQLAAERVLAKAGMTSATFDAPSAMRGGNYAVGHVTNEDGTLAGFFEPDTWDCSLLNPPGGLMASAVDYAHFIETMLAAGGGMLSPAAVKAMTSGHIDTGALPSQQYGYGLFTQPYGADTLLWHAGSLPGYTTKLGFVPELGFGLVVLTNGSAAQGDNPVPDDILSFALSEFASISSQPPRCMTSPTDWATYPGTYVDPYGLLGTVTVELVGGTLSMASTGLNTAGFVADGTLQQICLDDWSMPMGLSARFFRDDGGAPAYFVTRAGVAVRR